MNTKRIAIGGIERDVSDASPSWIREHVLALRSRDMDVCVKVSIRAGSLNIGLSTPACSATRFSDRDPNPEEQRILDLWHKRGMDKNDFEIGQLVAFLNEIKHV